MLKLSYLLVIAGTLAIGFCAAEWGRGWLYQVREEGRIHDIEPAAMTPAPPPRVRPRLQSAVAKLVIPRLGLSTIVLEGDSKHELELGLGHIPQTLLPGEGGNIAIAGHRDTFFRPLRAIRKNDLVDLVTPEHTFSYRVTSTEVVDPKDIRALDPTGYETLTLIICYPFYFVGAAPSRFIVRAERIAHLAP